MTLPPYPKEYTMTDVPAGDDGLHGINPLMADAVEGFTRATADAFLKVWTGPRAAEAMEGFLSGEVVFVIRRDELQVLAADSVRPRDPRDDDVPGQYL